MPILTTTEKTKYDNYETVKADATDLTTHTGATDNPHTVTKTQVGLSNVDNTSDVDKPISTATQNALDDKLDIVNYDKAHIDAMGIDANTVTGKTVDENVPSGAVFTDTIYDDSTTVKSEPTGAQISILHVVGITQDDYDALTPDANTLYVIDG